MTRLGQKKQLKRLPAPSHWPIARKEYKFTVRTRPGPHPKESSITLAILLREMLGYAKTLNEVKQILSSGQVLVDGRVRKMTGFPLGMMDVVEIKTSGEKFRILPKKSGGLRLVPIDEKESGVKLCRVQKKRMVAHGRVQFTLHDGRNVLLSEGGKPSEIHTLDTLKISIPDYKMISHMVLEKGAYAVVTRGNNVGYQGRVLDVQKRYGTHASTVTMEDLQGNKIQTSLDYVFVVGKQKPEVNLPVEGGASS